jgi:outer membrane beta-barrel protein
LLAGATALLAAVYSSGARATPAAGIQAPAAVGVASASGDPSAAPPAEFDPAAGDAGAASGKADGLTADLAGGTASGAASGTEPAPSPSPPGVDTDAPGQPADRIKAVPRKGLLKRHRLELTPAAAVSVNDPYYLHANVGGSAVYYPRDSFGVGVGAEYFYAHVGYASLTDVRRALTSVPPQFTPPSLLLHVDLYWVPLYGKVSLYDSGIAQFDVYGSVGAGMAKAFSGNSALEVNIGIGQHYVVAPWLSLRLELRDHLFIDTFVSNNQTGSSVQNYMLLSLGMSFYVPTTFEYSAL